MREYVKQAHPLERRGNGGPEQLPAGAAIMKLDDDGACDDLQSRL